MGKLLWANARLNNRAGVKYHEEAAKRFFDMIKSKSSLNPQGIKSLSRGGWMFGWVGGHITATPNIHSFQR